MTLSPLIQLRSFLTSLSARPVAFQTQFVQTMNSASGAGGVEGVEGTEMHSISTSVRTAAETFWRAGGVAVPSGPLASWVRWEDMAKTSGIGVLLHSPKSLFLLLPRETDPATLTFNPQVSDDRIVLIPNLTTLEMSPGGHPHYLRLSSLLARRRPAVDPDFYKVFLLEEPRKGRFAPMGIALPAGGETLLLEDANNGVYHALHAFQEGMEFYLCALGREAAGDISDAVTISGLVASYPKLPEVEPKDDSEPSTLPPSRFFGNGNPFFKRIRVHVGEDRSLFDSQGNEVGRAEIYAGGAPGKVTRPNFSAMTSNGRGFNPEDSLYVCEFQLPGQPKGYIAAVADGLGGAVLGEMASSAATQGVHAAVTQAISENRIPLPHEMAAAAAKALKAQFHHFRKDIEEEMVRELKNKPSYRVDAFPDSVLSVALVIGNQGFAASTGDALILLSRRLANGEVETLAHSDADSMDESMVNGTVGRNQWHYWSFPVEADTWVSLVTDGLLGSLMAAFKSRTSPYIRQNEGTARADQGAFHNINRILAATPPSHTAIALHNVAMGLMEIPVLSGGATLVEFSDLSLPPTDYDNFTGASIHQPDQIFQKAGVDVPAAYRPLEIVRPLHQYYFDVIPARITLPQDYSELFLGSAPQPSGQPCIILPDGDLSPLAARIFRVSGTGGSRYLLEKLTWGGRIVVKRGDGHTSESLIRKGATAEIHQDYKVELNRKTSFTFIV